MYKYLAGLIKVWAKDTITGSEFIMYGLPRDWQDWEFVVAKCLMAGDRYQPMTIYSESFVSHVKKGFSPYCTLPRQSLKDWHFLRAKISRGETSLKEHSQRDLQFSSVQSLSRVRLFATPWIAARQASLSTTNSRSSLRLKSIKSVMPSSHLILWRPLLLLPSIPPSIRVFSNESALRMRWPKYWSFSFNIIP